MILCGGRVIVNKIVGLRSNGRAFQQMMTTVNHTKLEAQLLEVIRLKHNSPDFSPKESWSGDKNCARA